MEVDEDDEEVNDVDVVGRSCGITETSRLDVVDGCC
jgi:hypothetical protein